MESVYDFGSVSGVTEFDMCLLEVLLEFQYLVWYFMNILLVLDLNPTELDLT